MNQVRRFLNRALLTLPLFALVACPGEKKTGPSGSPSAPAEAKVLKLGFVTNNPSQFWKIAEAGR